MMASAKIVFAILSPKTELEEKSAKQKFAFTMGMVVKVKKELWKLLIILSMILLNWMGFKMIFLLPLSL